MKIALAVLVALVVLLLFAGSPFDDHNDVNGWAPASFNTLHTESPTGARLDAEVRWYHDSWPHRRRYAFITRGHVTATRATRCIWVVVRYKVRLRSDGDPQRAESCSKGGRPPKPISLAGLGYKTTLMHSLEMEFGAADASGGASRGGGTTVVSSYR